MCRTCAPTPTSIRTRTTSPKSATRPGTCSRPKPDLRLVRYGAGVDLQEATVQITLRPMLSFRHAYEHTLEELLEHDLRRAWVQRIQAELDQNGLSHYVARPGGRTSVDVTLEKLDKAYALEFLIDHLNIQGQARLGQKLGTNAVYLGDEVIVGGGNDYPVTRIPGLLVFAVNPERSLMPFMSRVLVPSAVLAGPEASADVLSQINRCARQQLAKVGRPRSSDGSNPVKTALAQFKEQLFTQRIQDKLSRLRFASTEDLQTIHTFVTLMARNDFAAKQWLNILANELDAIMQQLAVNPLSRQRALGDSYDDGPERPPGEPVE